MRSAKRHASRFRLETDADGRPVLVEKRARSRGALLWDRIAVLVHVGGGLFILWLLASIVRDYIHGRTDLTSMLVMGALFGLPGIGFVVAGLLQARRGFPRTEVTRDVIDEDAYEILADLPDDLPAKRFLIKRGVI